MAKNSQNRKRLARWRPKLARSPKNRRRASPLQLVVRGVMVALAAQGLWVVFHSPRLAVRRGPVLIEREMSAGSVLVGEVARQVCWLLAQQPDREDWPPNLRSP